MQPCIKLLLVILVFVDRVSTLDTRIASFSQIYVQSTPCAFAMFTNVTTLGCASACLATTSEICCGFQHHDNGTCLLTRETLQEAVENSTTIAYKIVPFNESIQSKFVLISGPLQKYKVALNNTKVTHDEAKANCLSQGASLIFIDSVTKVSAVRSTFERNPPYYWTSPKYDESTDTWKDDNGRSISRGSDMWGIGEPSMTYDGQAELCVEAGSSGYLNDKRCFKKLPYL